VLADYRFRRFLFLLSQAKLARHEKRSERQRERDQAEQDPDQYDPVRAERMNVLCFLPHRGSVRRL